MCVNVIKYIYIHSIEQKIYYEYSYKYFFLFCFQLWYHSALPVHGAENCFYNEKDILIFNYSQIWLLLEISIRFIIKIL